MSFYIVFRTLAFFSNTIIINIYIFCALFVSNNIYTLLLISRILLNSFILLRKSCSIFSSFIIFIEIVCNVTLYNLIFCLIITSWNSNYYLSLHFSNLFAFNFLIVIIIIEVFFIDFDIVHTINFLIALLILLYILIEFLLVYFSIIRHFSLMLVFKIV